MKTQARTKLSVIGKGQFTTCYAHPLDNNLVILQSCSHEKEIVALNWLPDNIPGLVWPDTKFLTKEQQDALGLTFKQSVCEGEANVQLYTCPKYLPLRGNRKGASGLNSNGLLSLKLFKRLASFARMPSKPEMRYHALYNAVQRVEATASKAEKAYVSKWCEAMDCAISAMSNFSTEIWLECPDRNLGVDCDGNLVALDVFFFPSQRTGRGCKLSPVYTTLKPRLGVQGDYAPGTTYRRANGATATVYDVLYTRGLDGVLCFTTYAVKFPNVHGVDEFDLTVSGNTITANLINAVYQ